MGRLMSGPLPPGVSGQKVGPTFLGRLMAGSLRLLGRVATDAGPGPNVPTK